MKNSYQSKPIPLFTHYNGEYQQAAAEAALPFSSATPANTASCAFFPAERLRTPHVGKLFLFYPLYITWCKMRSHFLAFLSQDRPLSPYDKPEPMMSRAPLSLPFTCACYSSTPTVLRYIRKDRCSRNVIDITISFTRIHISSSFSILFFSSDQASTDCKILFETLPIQLQGKKR